MRKLIYLILSVFYLVLVSCDTTVKNEETFLEFEVLSDREVSVAGFKKSLNGNTIDKYNFKSISIPDNVVIANQKFSVVSVYDDAFKGCTSLTSIQIPNSVTEIGTSVFSGCTSLTSVEIPNSVTSIGSYAFLGCTSLTSIQIPNSVTEIGSGAFYGCTNLTSIVVDKNNKKYDSRENCNAIIETASNILIQGCQNTVIPNSVTTIGDLAFSGCESLTSIEIPNSITSIGEAAFYDCRGLTDIIIPKSVTEIGSGAFGDCTSLTSIEIPNSVTSIGNLAFVFCLNLKSVRVPKSCKVAYDAFEKIGCKIEYY